MTLLGYFVNCDDAECVGCHDPAAWPGSGDWEAPLPIFTSDEHDTPTHCAACGDLIAHALTDAGREYVADALDRRQGRPEVLDAWREEYGDQL